MRERSRSWSRTIPVLTGLVLLVLATTGLAQDKAQKIDELMSLYHHYGQFNGSVLVAENGKVIYKKGFGLANMEWGIPNTPDTKFRLGSLTKQFTAMLVVQSVEKGELSLVGTISDYLPYYRKDIGKKVTIHHLLTHTSGIPSYTSLPNFFLREISRKPYEVRAFVETYCSNDLDFEPGSRYSYNNSGYFLLGAILEEVTGKTYEELLQERILEPLGMKDSGYDHHDTILENRAAGYEKSLAGYVNAPYLDTSTVYAAGGLYSTVEDFYLWDQALYTERLLSAEYKEKMFTPSIGQNAYGWIVRKEPVVEGGELRTRIWHGGEINRFSTLITRITEDRHLVVLLNNTSCTRLGAMTRAILRILYGQPGDPPKQSIAEVLRHTIREKGVEAAVAQYRRLKQSQPDAYDFHEGELNNLGYMLLLQKRTADAIAIFQLNVEAYPESFNVYDSLGEAYMENGDYDLAIKNYAKSLELNPRNINALERLNKLVKVKK
ncbi:MAG: serine hydrolase [Terriglobia bacterium]